MTASAPSPLGAAPAESGDLPELIAEKRAEVEWLTHLEAGLRDRTTPWTASPWGEWLTGSGLAYSEAQDQAARECGEALGAEKARLAELTKSQASSDGVAR